MGQSWDANPIHDVINIASDVGGVFIGPPGDPGRVRQAAQRVDHLASEYRQSAEAINEAVDVLTRTWTGDGGQAFHAKWFASGGDPGPSHVLNDMHRKLTTFADGLRDYASRLENKQHDHWIQLAALAAMTVVNAAQLGADPATDAAEVGMATAMQLGGSAASGLATFAGREAFALFASDVVGQLGAHVWDSFDNQFEHGVVPVIDQNELASVLPLPACSVVGPDMAEGEPAVPGAVGVTADGTLRGGDAAVIPREKFDRYSMDPANPQNANKWRAFQTLGYDVTTAGGRATAARSVIYQIRQQLTSLPANVDGSTGFGDQVRVEVPIVGPTGKSGSLVTIWQFDTGSSTPRLITNWLKV